MTLMFCFVASLLQVKQLTCNLVMSGTSYGRKCINIKTRFEKHVEIVDTLLPAQVLSDCDTVFSLWGLGKGKVVKVLKSERSLSMLGNIQEHFEDVKTQCTMFVTS